MGKVSIEIFNRRKMFFEPFLEPWKFLFKVDKKGPEKLIEIMNWEPAYDPSLELYDRYINKNALNFNISTATLETFIEIYKVLTGKMRRAEAYRIRNYTGFTLRITSSAPSTHPQKEIILFD
jgi:vacuolar protein sorting-associated protein 13A/C